MMIRKALGALACAAVLAPSIVLADSAGGDETTSQMQRDPLDQPGLRSQALPLGGSRDQVDSGTAFNPALSVILDGVYYSEISGEWDSPAGFDSGHSHSHGHGHDHDLDEGFNLRETELAFSASVDNYFDAMVILALEGDSGIEVEEAYLTTQSLPAGLQVKAGKFLSDIGYINKQHPHDWDFVDRPLVNEFLFGDHGLQEKGVQISWTPATPVYTRFGVEILQGESSGIANYEGSGSHTITGYDTGANDPGAGRERSEVDFGLEDKSGPRLFTGFFKVAPDLGYDHAAQFGLSYGYVDTFQNVETHGSGRADVWDGDGWFAGLDAVYKHDSGGAYGHGNLQLQAEYFMRELDLEYTNVVPTGWNRDGGEVADQFSDRRRQDGLYMQAVYGFAPRWEVGARFEALGLTNDSVVPDRDAGEFESFDTSYRYGLSTTWRPTHFSALRAQVNYNDFAKDNGHTNRGAEVMLQYNLSLGVHGAHPF